MFGALISATDPVAVVALLKDVGASKRLGTIIEGESLLNDGSAFVLFLIFKVCALSYPPPFSPPRPFAPLPSASYQSRPWAFLLMPASQANNCVGLGARLSQEYARFGSCCDEGGVTPAGEAVPTVRGATRCCGPKAGHPV